LASFLPEASPPEADYVIYVRLVCAVIGLARVLLRLSFQLRLADT